MKLFLTVFQEMINEKVSDNKISEETLRRMAAEYKRLSSSEQAKSIQILHIISHNGTCCVEK